MFLLRACRQDGEVAIPLGQGQVFNDISRDGVGCHKSQSLWVRDRFLIKEEAVAYRANLSQSLWVRDRFLIEII